MEKATWQIRTSFRMMLRPQLESSHSISGELYGGVLMLDLKDKLSSGICGVEAAAGQGLDSVNLVMLPGLRP